MNPITKPFLLSLGFEEGYYTGSTDGSSKGKWIPDSDCGDFRLSIGGEGYGRTLWVCFDPPEEGGLIEVRFSSFGMASSPLFSRNCTEDRLLQLIAVLKG